MDKRKLAYTLLLGGITAVALLHIVLALAFDTGLAEIGALVAGLGVFGILFVNFGLPERTGEADDEPNGPGSDPD